MTATAKASSGTPAAPHGLTREQLLELYQWMRLTRTLEERLVNLYRQTKVAASSGRSARRAAPWARRSRSSGATSCHR
jgi:TPP-dependent pyruvate/acetoin dehydrogenase alpha subunit